MPAKILGEGCVIESGTFFASKTIDAHESLMLSSKLTRRGDQGCTLEEEIFDDSCFIHKGDTHVHGKARRINNVYV